MVDPRTLKESGPSPASIARGSSNSKAVRVDGCVFLRRADRMAASLLDLSENGPHPLLRGQVRRGLGFRQVISRFVSPALVRHSIPRNLLRVRQRSLLLEAGDVALATTLHEFCDFPAGDRTHAERRVLLPLDERHEPCRKALVAVDPADRDAGVEQDHRDASQSSEATPSKRPEVLDRQTGERITTGRRRFWHRLKRVNRDADGLTGLEGEPGSPDRAVRSDDGRHMDVPLLVAHALAPFQPVVDQAQQ